MAYIAIILILILFYFIGEAVTGLLKIEEKKHVLPYGFLFYLSFFFVLTFPQAILQVSWSFYFIVMSLYTAITGIGSIIYTIKHKRFNVKLPGKYFRENWPVLLLITILIVPYYFTRTTEFIFEGYGSLAVAIDNHVYMANAMQGINQESIFQLAHGTVFMVFPGNIANIIALWEFSWAFGSQVFGLNMLTFVHTTLPPIIYIVVMLLLDEVYYLLFKKQTSKGIKYAKYAIFSMLPLILFNDFALEALKFVYFPWFGNVIVTMMFVPFIIIFLYHALTKPRILLFLFFLPFIFAGFNGTALIYTWFYYPIATFVWYRYKKYQFRFEKLVLFSFISIVLLFLFASLIQGRLQFWRTLSDLFARTHGLNVGEYDIFRYSLGHRRIFVIVAFFTYLFRVSLKKTGPIEGYFMGSSFALLALSSVPYIDILPFNLFNFSYTRLMHGLTLSMMLYNSVTIIMLLELAKPRMVMLGLLGILLINFNGAIPNFIRWPGVYNINAISNPERVNQAVLSMMEDIKSYPGDKNICFYPHSLGTDKQNEARRIDFASVMLATDTDSYLAGCYVWEDDRVDLTGIDFVVTTEDDAEFLRQVAEIDGTVQFISARSDDHVDLRLYQVIK